MGRRQAHSRRGSALAGVVRRSRNCSFVQKTGGQTAACLHPACGHRSSGAGRRSTLPSRQEKSSAQPPGGGRGKQGIPASQARFPGQPSPAGCGANWDDWDWLVGPGLPAWKVPPPPSTAVCTAMEQLGVLQPRGVLEKSQPLMITLEL